MNTEDKNTNNDMNNKQGIDSNPEFQRTNSYSWEEAEYHEQDIWFYKGSPFIEALPPILEEKQVIKRLRYLPPYNLDDRFLPKEKRYHLIYNSNQFFRPLSIHIELQRDIDLMIRSGYLGRNPINSLYYKSTEKPLDEIENNGDSIPVLRSTATGFYMVGISGVGKSTAFKRILQTLYKQVIRHRDYKGKIFRMFQIVWLFVECPYDGSLGGLCKAIFEAIDELLDTHYLRDYGQKSAPSIDDMIIAIRRLARLHGIGCLVIDEIQHLSTQKGHGTTLMLNFFVNLVNRIGMPVVLVGTPKASPLLTKEFQQARRASGVGDDRKWYPMEMDEEWTLFVKALWKYQYVYQRQEELPDEISRALHYVSAGIVDFAIKAFLLAQYRAIDTANKPQDERITKELIEAVGQDSFAFAADKLDRLRNHRYESLTDIPDIDLFDMKAYHERFMRQRFSGNYKNLLMEEESAESTRTNDRSSQAKTVDEKTKDQETIVCKKPGWRRVKGADELLRKLNGDDLRYLFLKAEKNGISMPETLEKAGYSKDVTEFFYE